MLLIKYLSVPIGQWIRSEKQRNSRSKGQSVCAIRY